MLTRRFTCLLSAVAMLGLLIGCNSGKDQADKNKPAAGKDAHGKGEHAAHADHGTEGPHGGHLIELGGHDYHAELLHDEPTHTVTVYILDGSAKKETAVAEDAVELNVVLNDKARQFKMKAADVKDGKASKFTVDNVDLVHAFEEAAVTKGKLKLTIGADQYIGTIDHHKHGDHEDHGDHDHGDHDHGDHDHGDHDHSDHEEGEHDEDDHDGVHHDGEHEDHDDGNHKDHDHKDGDHQQKE